MRKKAAVLMGSDSDLPVVQGAIRTLKDFGVETEVHIMSAHRTPHKVMELRQAQGKTASALSYARQEKRLILPEWLHPIPPCL